MDKKKRFLEKAVPPWNCTRSRLSSSIRLLLRLTTSGVCRHKTAEALSWEAGRVGIGVNTPYLSSGPARRSILDLTSLRTRQLEARERCDYI